MSESRDIKFKYRGYAYVFRPPGRGTNNVLTETPCVFRDHALRYKDTGYISHAYCTKDEMPIVYEAIKIWLRNGWQESISFQDLINGLE